MTLLLPDLADNDSVRAHPQCLFDQPAKGDLTGSLKVGLPCLHRHHIWQGHLKFEDLFGRDHPFAGRNRRTQRVEHGGLAGLRTSRHQHVQPGSDRCLQEPGCRLGQRTQPDELVQARDCDHELSNVDRHVQAGDRWNHDMQSRAVRQLGVDERGAEIQAPPGQPQHPFDQISHLVAGQDDGGQLRPAAAGDEHPSRLVDPDLLHRRVVEVLLQRTEAGDLIEHRPGGRLGITQRRQHRHRGTVQIVRQHLIDQPPGRFGLQHRIELAPAHQLANLALHDRLRARHHSPPTGSQDQQGVELNGLNAWRGGFASFVDNYHSDTPPEEAPGRGRRRDERTALKENGASQGRSEAGVRTQCRK